MIDIKELAKKCGATPMHPYDYGMQVDSVIISYEDLSKLVERVQARQQAQIDALMLEYCPDEMTPEQIRNWGDHQVPIHGLTDL